MGKGTRFMVTAVTLVCFNFFMLAGEAKAYCSKYSGYQCVEETTLTVESRPNYTGVLVVLACVGLVVLAVVMHHQNAEDEKRNKANLMEGEGIRIGEGEREGMGKRDKLEYLVVADGTFSLVRW